MDLINKIHGFSPGVRPQDNTENYIQNLEKSKSAEDTAFLGKKIKEEEKKIEENKKNPQLEAKLQEQLKRYREAGIMEREKMKEFLQLTVPSIEKDDKEADNTSHVNELR